MAPHGRHPLPRRGGSGRFPSLARLWLVSAMAACALAPGGRPGLADQPSPAAPNAWAAGGGPPTAPPNAAAVPLAQAWAMPGTVIHGGAIPAGWQPQPIPYQGIGADGRPMTVYVAPTYTFTFVSGPPMVAAARNQVNRIQALPPTTTAYMRAPTAPYQYPSGSPALAGQPLAPPPTAAPPLPVQAPAPLAPPPPTQWVSVPPGSAPVVSGGGGGTAALAAAAPAVMAGTAGAVAAADRGAPPAAIAPPPAPAVAPPPAAPVDPPLETVPPPAARSAATSPPSAAHRWRVVGVHDGDTLTCLDENNDQQKVRLAEIDAPELGQDFGRVARESLAELVFGKTVTVQDDGKDRYGRWIARMQVDGIDVNRRMVATGNAWHYADYSRDTALGALEEQARTQRLGLWAQADPVAPWDFRQSAAKAPAT